ncbi:LysR family transcriptional regulator [Aliamphritea ceti]|uniref:LysR family transcriptional regulator n=1 Tax=Aliamphritea ceti TaxID=1524258 RepID=UPI0021C2CB77|nr:LysR family transcriptional regulator [Aliamphritea ceti]
MKLDDLSQVDLRLLVAFNALMEELSVTRAADRLSSSQPAMSRNLRQLRLLFADELFTRQSHGLAATPRAEQLHLQMRPLLDSILRLVAPVQLDPMQLERCFSLSVIDPISQSLITPLLSYLQEHAPLVTLKIQGLEEYSMDMLVAGQLDFIINFGNEAPANIHSRILAEELPVCVFGLKHPLAGRSSISYEEFIAQKHVDCILPGFYDENLPDWLMNIPNPHLQTNNMVTALNAVCDSQLMMVGGELLSQYSPRVNETVRIPFAEKEQIPLVPIRLLWHKRYHDDLAHQWMRNIINQFM